MGAICCLWLGARRSGHALLRALAYPAMGLLLLTLVLAYSRGALVALAVGLVLWFCMVPLRLRGAALLIVGALGAAAVAAWDFSTHALSSEGVALAERTSAGHQLGALVVAMLVGAHARRCRDRLPDRPPRTVAAHAPARRRGPAGGGRARDARVRGRARAQPARASRAASRTRSTRSRTPTPNRRPTPPGA